jgi:hypothetical protein
VTFSSFSRGRSGRRGGGLIDEEEGVRGERRDGGGAGVGVSRLLLEELFDVVSFDVSAPCLLPLPRALRRPPHRRRRRSRSHAVVGSGEGVGEEAGRARARMGGDGKCFRGWVRVCAV